MKRSTVLGAAAGLMAATGLWAAAPAVSSTPAESVTANFVSGPFHITFTADRAAGTASTAATGAFNATSAVGGVGLVTLAGPVSCLDIVGHDIGLFYAVGASSPAALYDAVHGVYIYVTDSSSGTPQTVSFVPSQSGTAASCAPIPGVIPISSGTATIDPPAPAGTAAIATTLEVSDNAVLGRNIAVDSRGVTVYELKPETTHHLLCTKANGCFRVWHPLIAPSTSSELTAAPGIAGKLGILRRNGIRQITLGGRPLYRFSGDRAMAGSAAGQGIRSFRGTWHVVTATASTPSPAAPTTTTTAPSGGYPTGY